VSRSRGLESSAHTPGECMTTSPSSQSYHRVCAIGLRYTSIDPPWYGCVSSFCLHSHLTPRSPSRFPNSLRNTLSLPSPLLFPSSYPYPHSFPLSTLTLTLSPKPVILLQSWYNLPLTFPLCFLLEPEPSSLTTIPPPSFPFGGVVLTLSWLWTKVHYDIQVTIGLYNLTTSTSDILQYKYI
jgi:hypothetical protein